MTGDIGQAPWRVDPEIAIFLGDFLCQFERTPYQFAPAVGAKVLLGVQSGVSHPRPLSITEERWADGRGGSIRVRLYRPPSALEAPSPAILFFHGGYTAGCLDTHDRLARDLCIDTDMPLVAVDCRFARGGGLRLGDAAFTAFQQMAAEAPRLGIDSGRIAVVGDGSGGLTATTVVRRVQTLGVPTVRAQVLFYPLTDHRRETLSHLEFADGPWLTSLCVQRYLKAAFPGGCLARSDLFPSRATPRDLAGLPPTLIILAENDPLRDDGEVYARKLQSAGVPVVSTRYHGAIHDFLMLNGVARTAAARSALQQTVEFLQRALRD